MDLYPFDDPRGSDRSCAVSFAVADVFSSGRGTEALDNLASGFSGYGARLLSFGNIVADRTVGGPLLAAACLAGVVLAVTAGWHKYQEYREYRSDGAEKAGQNVGPNAGPNARILSLLIVPVIGYFLLASRMSPYLVDRYVMPLFPLAALLLALLLCYPARSFRRYADGQNRQRESA